MKVSVNPAPRKNTSGISPSDRKMVSVPMVEGPSWMYSFKSLTVRRSISPKIVSSYLTRSDSMVRIAPLSSASSEIGMSEIGIEFEVEASSEVGNLDRDWHL